MTLLLLRFNTNHIVASINTVEGREEFTFLDDDFKRSMDIVGIIPIEIQKLVFAFVDSSSEFPFSLEPCLPAMVSFSEQKF